METVRYALKARLPTKQEALLFDETIVFRPMLMFCVRQDETRADILAEFAYLDECGIVRSLPSTSGPVALDLEREINEFHDQVGALTQGPNRLASIYEDGLAMDQFQEETWTRCLTLMAKQLQISAVPIWPDFPCIFPKKATTTDLSCITVKSLPTLSGEVAWEKVVDFRADPGARDSLRRLRHWLRNLDSEKLSAAEVHEELDYLLHEYESHMSYHKMKFRKGILRAVITFPFEAIENVIKLRLKNTIDALYRVDDLKVALLEAEMSAPGREVAYIAQAREQFPK